MLSFLKLVVACLLLQLATLTAAKPIILNDANYKAVIPRYRSTELQDNGAPGTRSAIPREDDTLLVLVSAPGENHLKTIFAEAAEATETASDEVSSNYRFAIVEDDGSADVLLARWLVFRTPALLILEKGGMDVRFMSARLLGTTSEDASTFLTSAGWLKYPVWATQWSPRGRLHGLLEYVGRVYQVYKNTVGRLPATAVLIVAIGLGRVIQSSLDKDRRRAQATQSVPAAQHAHAE